MSTIIKEHNKYYRTVELVYIEILEKKPEKVSVILSQLRIFDTKRVTEYLGHLNAEDFSNIKTALRSLI